MDAVGPKEIGRILAVTDEIGLHREAVSIPLGTEGAGRVTLAGAHLEIVAPADGDFESWVGSLGDRIRALDLSGVQRS
jgi:hypothetical protein